MQTIKLWGNKAIFTNTLFAIIIIIFSCLFGFVNLILSTKTYAILQQNYYNLPTLFWCYNYKNPNYKSIKIPYIVSMILTSLLIIIFNLCGAKIWFCLFVLLLLFVTMCFLTFKLNIEELKKPLVVTKRIKRLIITNFVLLFFSYYFVLYLSVSVNTWFMLFIVLLQQCFGCFVILSNFINIPLEKLIQQIYILKAKAKLKQFKNLIVIGITGSYGKTSTKNYLCEMLKTKYSVLCTPASYNTPMGITRTILNNLKPYHQILILEMGADHKNDINKLCKIVKPDVSIITAVGAQHLKTFKTVENIIKTKYQIVLNTKQSGFFVTNSTNEICKGFANKSHIESLSVGNNNNDFCKIEHIEQLNENMVITFKFNNKVYKLSTSLIGEFNAINILLGFVVAFKLGVSFEEVRNAVKNLKAVKHRLEVKKLNNGAILIDDSFNSNPLGAKMAINALNNFNKKRYVITCGMVELGEKQFEENYNLGKNLKDVDEVLVVNSLNFDAISSGMIDCGCVKPVLFNHFNEAYEYVSSKLDCNSVLLIENDLSDCYINF